MRVVSRRQKPVRALGVRRLKTCAIAMGVSSSLLWLCSVLYLSGPTLIHDTNGHLLDALTKHNLASQPPGPVRTEKLFLNTGSAQSPQSQPRLKQPAPAGSAHKKKSYDFGSGQKARDLSHKQARDLSDNHPSSAYMDEQASTVLCGGHRAASCPACILGHDPSWCHGECSMFEGKCQPQSAREHATIPQIIRALIQEYPFQPVITERNEMVNIVLVRSPMGQSHKEDMERYKDKILFLGICSMEDYPLPSPNPFSGKFSAEEYVGLFPGWLHMFRNPESIFPSHVKLLLQSQSDFSLPHLGGQWTFEKKYDFVFSGTDQDVASDCVGWSSFAKNWTFVLQALEVMCGEYGMTGVLVATKDKSGQKACTIPRSCDGKVLQTSFLPQPQFFDYVKQSRFALLPQVHDASPRAATHALALNTPVLMNWHIMGGWKYVNEKTGEFFHDMSDFRTSLQKLMHNLGNYEPRKYMLERYGDEIQGARLKQFVLENFGSIVKLPTYTRTLLPSGA